MHDGRHRRLGAEAVTGALTRLEAVLAPSGEIPVVLAAGQPGTWLHETVGHGLEADHAANPGSAYHGRLGRRVAAAQITVIDDPTPAGQPPLYSVDDEGEAARRTVLIEDGVLRDRLYDWRTAQSAGLSSNGHGRRLDYSWPALPRTSATYVLPGRLSAEEIISDTSRGLLVVSVSGGDTDMGSGRFNLRVDEGYLIERGRVTAPITGATLSGRALDALRGVDRLGSDLEFVNLCLVCNKLEQFPMLVSVGQPTLRIAGLDVWGGSS